MNIPPLPKIEGDIGIILDIYCHHSLKGDPPMNDEYGDTDRLVELGAKALDMALATHYFYKRPLLLADQISDYAQDAVSDDKLRTWLTFYNIKSNFRTAPGTFEILESPDEMRRFFKAYIGALYIRNGPNHVQPWISSLIDPGADMSSFATPPQPLGLPPPLPHQMPPHISNNPLPTSGSAHITLALVNQTASQKGFSVTYPAEQLGGPAHAPTWRVSCCLNGIKKGEGSGKNQKAAKEEAGRQAFQAMGW
ncbi:hypothetical protein B0H19DRAFT_1127907 [Mycena capillaripes]|nr:hypothetical protein B0H19DRAFT_1127907 [Mycena capillaripes]